MGELRKEERVSKVLTGTDSIRADDNGRKAVGPELLPRVPELDAYRWRYSVISAAYLT